METSDGLSIYNTLILAQTNKIIKHDIKMH